MKTPFRPALPIATAVQVCATEKPAPAPAAPVSFSRAVLPTGNPAKVHGQFRRAGMTAAGTFLAAHVDDNKVVWALRAWDEPANLGPAINIQLLDEPGIPENGEAQR